MGATANRLGWITSISVEQKNDFADVSSYGRGGVSFIPTVRTIEADLHIVANNGPALMEQFQEWMRGDFYGPVFQKEYMCLYCGSPNNIENTHCSKCGAPRSFVIG